MMELKRTGNNKYTRGRHFEYQVKKKFENAGYYVIRAASSKGPADLVAFGPGALFFVQCKIGDWHSVNEWNDTKALAESVGATPIFAQRKDRKTLLWVMDRDKDASRRTVLHTPLVLEESRHDR